MGYDRVGGMHCALGLAEIRGFYVAFLFVSRGRGRAWFGITSTVHIPPGVPGFLLWAVFSSARWDG